MADEPEVKFRVPETPKVIVAVGPRIVVDPEELKLLVPASPDEVKALLPPLPPFADLQKLRELCLAADEYHRDTGSKVLLECLREALAFAEKLGASEGTSSSKPIPGHTCGVLGPCECKS